MHYTNTITCFNVYNEYNDIEEFTMKIALIGATGFVGSFLLTEALNRGHKVTALVRYTEKLPQHANLTGKICDLLDEDLLGQIISDHDAVISAYNSFQSGISNSIAYELQLRGIKSILNAVKKAGVKRLLIVGGAGSLKIAPGLDLVDSAEFPKEWKEMALAMREALSILKSEHDVDWTFLSPSAHLQPGDRTGKFRLGRDQLLVNINGESKISTQDYAMAMLNELENPQHTGQRFTVGY